MLIGSATSFQESPQWRWATDTGKLCGTPIPDREKGRYAALRLPASTSTIKPILVALRSMWRMCHSTIKLFINRRLLRRLKSTMNTKRDYYLLFVDSTIEKQRDDLLAMLERVTDDLFLPEHIG